MAGSQFSEGLRFSTSSTAQTLGLGLVAVVGIYAISTFLYSLIGALLSIFVLPGKPLKSFGPRGSWALITGASDGLGKEYARRVAQQGFNLILVSRTASKLDELTTELKKDNPSIQVVTYAMDFAKNDPSDFAQVGSLIKGKDISILLNNVGVSHSIPVSFNETPADEMKTIITVNCFGTLQITRLVLPGMIERKRGLIMTMGSFGGTFPTPYLATYCGSKAFLQNWSTALASEVEDHGITVHFVQANLVVSAMSKIRRPTLMVPPIKPFVKVALSKIGRQGGTTGYAFTGSPYWTHALFVWTALNVFHLNGHYVLKQNKKLHMDIRRRALAKQERERKKALDAKSK